MTETVAAAPTVTRTRTRIWELEHWHPSARLVLRWALIAVLTVVAFHRSLADLVLATSGGSLISYVWLLPPAGALAALGVARRQRTELPIHDRQTDLIVGGMGLVLSVLLHSVLLARYQQYYRLLQLDLLAMWVFLVCAATLLFGLRPVIRFTAVWVLMGAVFPLWYYLLVILAGGGSGAAAVGTLAIAGAAAGIAVGRTARRGVIGAAVAWAVGLGVLGLLALIAPNVPIVVYQLLPALTAIAGTGLAMYLLSRRGAPKRLFDRKMEPLSTNQVWKVVPVIAAVAVGLSLVPLPEPETGVPRHVDARMLDGPPAPPPGWRVAATADYPWVSRVFGRDALLQRQKLAAVTGDHRFDKFARPRTLVLDTLTTEFPHRLKVFPPVVIYDTSELRFGASRTVDLGHGVTGSLGSAVDDRLLVTWKELTWTWTNGTQSQRMMVVAVDNHEDKAPFPEPTGGLVQTLNTILILLFRGNAALTDDQPNLKDDDLVLEFARGVVDRQFAGAGPSR
ncbi:hypothetical protein [Mycolicibacterium fallax]|uniref:hypothetical protein n=1 Tax=Mycolicibacterium fallax TaxID=1793 RepID=UPI001055FDB5|nr:hypothetical protein [Mycolicibacterium fallax]BBY98648.1 hypothetical protein MFAL_21150 [Mycolicibacterium fallax]